MILQRIFKASLTVALFIVMVSQAQAVLQFEERLLEVDTEPGQTRVDFSFPFVNEGEVPVTITNIRSSCGCTTAELEKRTYAPGEGAEIEGVIQLGSRQGRQRMVVRLETDQVAQPEIALTVQVDIPTLLKITPGMVLWRQNTEPDAKVLRLEPNAGQGVEILGVESAEESFQLEWVLPEEEGSAHEVIVAATDTSQPLRSLIRIRAQLPDGEERVFFAHALVR